MYNQLSEQSGRERINEGKGMSETSLIYVALLNEGVDVWRPVQAEHVERDIYRILSQPYDRLSEHWQFEPGDVVLCKTTESADGPILAAIEKVQLA